MIPTYLSHSYRAADRALNETFCRYFWDQGFAFTVDPKSETPTISHLEVMMNWSAAFVAIAPMRSEVGRYRTSPFIVYECGLAQQADRPSLVFVEVGVTSSVFDTENLIAFERQSIEDTLTRETSRIQKLHERSRPDLSSAVRALGTVGIFLPTTKPYRSATPLIADVLEQAGYRAQVVRTDYEDPWRLLIELRQHDFVVTDIDLTHMSGRLFPLLYGAFIPTVKLVHVVGGRVPAPLPALATSQALRSAEAEGDVAIRWSTEEELVARLSSQVSKLQGPRTQFRSLQESLKYFRSLDRRSSGPVFVSNAGEDNDLARNVIRLLELYNVEVFHYVYHNRIQRGVDFASPLRDAVTSSAAFIPLISDSYWKSKWCVEEYELALRMRDAGRLTVIPYFLDAVDSHDVPIQGVTISEMNADEQASKIVSDVDDFLTAALTSPPIVRSGPTIASQRGTIDVAIVTVLPQEYAAVRERLDAPVGLVATKDQPNKYAWDLGEIRSPSYEMPYRVVLGLAGGPGSSGGLQAVTDTVRTFLPRYVLLVGIAGGLRDVSIGDVVVSDEILGYEYGKVDVGRFQPRTKWTYRTDTAIVTSAQTAEVRFPHWHRSLDGLHGRKIPPRVVVGPIASGNKVVDDVRPKAFEPVMRMWPKLVAVEMEGLGAAEAVNALREDGIVVNFAMIRGISDLPLGSSAATQAGWKESVRQTAQRDNSKPLAAAAAAEYAVHVVSATWPVAPIAEGTAV